MPVKKLLTPQAVEHLERRVVPFWEIVWWSPQERKWYALEREPGQTQYNDIVELAGDWQTFLETMEHRVMASIISYGSIQTVANHTPVAGAKAKKK